MIVVAAPPTDDTACAPLVILSSRIFMVAPLGIGFLDSVCKLPSSRAGTPAASELLRKLAKPTQLTRTTLRAPDVSNGETQQSCGDQGHRPDEREEHAMTQRCPESTQPAREDISEEAREVPSRDRGRCKSRWRQSSE
jgi:hypothetical protein